MTKRFLLIDPEIAYISKQPKEIVSTDWELCALCQKDTGEALQFPERNTRQTFGCGYKSLATNLSEFRKLGCLPLDIDLERRDNGSGIEATFETNLAAWHKTCLQKFSNMKLDRAMKKRLRRAQLVFQQLRTHLALQHSAHATHVKLNQLNQLASCRSYMPPRSFNI